MAKGKIQKSTLWWMKLEANCLSMSEAANMVGVTPQKFGTMMSQHLIPNGLRVYRTSVNNKGSKINKPDLQKMIDVSVKKNIPIYEVAIPRK